MARHGPKIELSPSIRRILEKLAASRTKAARLVERAQIVLAAADGQTGRQIAETLGCDQQRPQRWRRRWSKQQPSLREAELGGASERDLKGLVEAVLDDRQRSGTPRTFSSDTVAKLVALACEQPSDSEIPVSHWTPDALAKEAIKRGIVTSISARHLDRLLKRGRATPAQNALLDDVEGQAGES